MKLNFIKTFLNDESGAVTVDWVVLTAAIVGLGLVVMQSVGGGITTLTGKIAGDLGEMNTTTWTVPGGSGGSTPVTPE